VDDTSDVRPEKGSAVCGIAGILGPGADDVATLRRMADRLEHRGPDAEGVYAQGPVGFSHRRLAVIGLGEAGAQPMTSRSGRFVVSFNGELYNHLELRSQLSSATVAPAWRGGSDTETLLAGVEAWGVRGLIERTVGMFVLAVWDRDTRTLVLARDRMGEKPLYWALDRGRLLFASQPSALREVPGFSPSIDRDALADLLRYGHVPAPRTIHHEVQVLPPGTLLEVALGQGDEVRGRPEPTSWWSMLDTAAAALQDPFAGDAVDAVDAVEAAVTTAVRGQMLSDVPLGAFLSGGIDSSLVVATMQRISSRPVRTFTIGFAEAGFDESVHARRIAAHLGTDHTDLVLSPAEAQAIVPQLPRIYDEPFADSSQIPTLLVSRLARQHVTVALSGDGGDELFGGYERYAQAEQRARMPRTVGLMAAAAFGLLGQPRKRSAALTVGRTGPDAIRRLLSANPLAESMVLGVDGAAGHERFEARWDATAALGGITERFMALDSIGYLPDDILHKVDRAAMAVSLETRVPLLDHRLVRLAWTLPHDVKVRAGTTKWVLREALARVVPRELFERPKMGFGVPIGAWLRGPLRGWADELLAPDLLRSDGWLDVPRVTRLWTDHVRGRWDATYDLWPILMFQAWLHDGPSRTRT
jgi:asparagine synthase (glutamine-hydrolysing)